MSYKEVLEKISEIIHNELPSTSEITNIEFEGAEVAVYSKNPRVLVNDETIVRELAKKIRKRIVIRSDPEVRLPKDETIYIINDLVGKEGEITSFDFDDIVGEVIIEALKPGVIIGKSGEMLRNIIAKTLWRPRVIRTPPIESRVIKSIRHLLQENAQRRLEILRNIGKRIHRPSVYRSDTIRVTALGGYGEVGRSASLVQTGESNVLVDCGINVGSTSPNNMFPRFDFPEFDIEQLDAVIVSHAHLDHCLPPHTLIYLANGEKCEIKDIKEGDVVLSFNWNTGEFSQSVCIGKTVTNKHKEILEIYTASSTIEASLNHRFFIVERFMVKEIEARELKEGTLLPLFIDKNQDPSITINTNYSNNELATMRLVPITISDLRSILFSVENLKTSTYENLRQYIEKLSNKLKRKGRVYLTLAEAKKVLNYLRAIFGSINVDMETNSSCQISINSALITNDITQKVVTIQKDISLERAEISDYINKIAYLLSLDVVWEPILEIKLKRNTIPLVDIEVYPDRNFVAENIIVHNSGFVPYLFKYGYDGPVYCTRPTRDLMTLLQIDYLDVASKEGKLLPYEQREIRETVLHTIVLDYGEVTDISPDIRLTFHNAGHIVGSAIPHLHIGEGVYNMAFAHDIKFARSRLLDPAIARFPRLETLFIESTYGRTQDVLPPRAECEKLLRNIVYNTIKRGGKVLIPVLAVGRAQEIIVVLEQFIRKGELPKVPIYTDGMIREASAITICHPEFLSRSLRDKIFHEGENPFLAEEIKQVSSNEERERVVSGDPAIILATSGMLTGGPSVYYFKSLCEDPKNSLVFVSYQGKGTLGSRIQKGIKEIQLMEEGKAVMYHVAMEVHSISGFTGHSDRKELEQYVMRVSPKPERYVVLHGEESKTTKFAAFIYKTTKRESLAPLNGTTIRLV